jgi:hypothetical protein
MRSRIIVAGGYAPAEPFAHRRGYLGTHQGPSEQRVDEGPVFIRQLGEWQPDLLGNRATSGDLVRKSEFMERVWVSERAHVVLDPKLLIEQPHQTTTVSPASSASTS